MRSTSPTTPNTRAALDAGRALCLHILRRWHRATERGRRAAMHCSYHILGLACIAMLMSCRRASPPAAATQPSLEQRVSNLEESMNGSAPRRSEEDLRKEAERDLAEIRSLGLVDRAQRDFSSRRPGAVVESFRVSYFINTNVVWCDVSYKLPRASETKDQGFGYKRSSGTNWDLTWDNKDNR